MISRSCMAVILLSFCGVAFGNQNLAGIECDANEQNVVIKYKLENKSNKAVYLFDTKNVIVSTSGEVLYVFLGRIEELVGVMYFSFTQPKNIKIEAGNLLDEHINIDLEKYKIDRSKVRRVVLSVAITDENLFYGQAYVKPRKFYNTVKEKTLIEKASCEFGNVNK